MIASSRLLAVSAVSSLLGQGLAAAAGIIVARVLGPEDRGELQLVIVVGSLAALVSLSGLGQAATYLAARNEASLSDLCRALRVPAAGGFCLSVLAGPALVIAAGASKETLAAVLIYSTFVPLNLHTQVRLGYLNGVCGGVVFHILRITPNIAIVVGIVSLWLANRLSILRIAIVYLGANAIALGATHLWLRHLRVDMSDDKRLSGREIWRVSLPHHAADIALQLNMRLDQLILPLIASSRALGLYVPAVSISSPFSLLGIASEYVLFPRAAKGGGLTSGVRVRIVIVALTLLAGGAALMTLLARPIVMFLLGPQYLESVPLLQILAWASAAHGLGMVSSGFLRGAGQVRSLVVSQVCALVATVLGLIVLVPSLAARGAAITSLISYSLLAALATWYSLNASSKTEMR